MSDSEDVESGRLTPTPVPGGEANGLYDLIHSISNRDAASAYRGRTSDNGTDEDDVAGESNSLALARTKTVSWQPADVENPHNFSYGRKWAILLTSMFCIVNSTMGSSLPSMAIPFITAEWGVTSQEQQVLPISTYLIGYVLGPIFWGPLSEHLGRRYLTIFTFVMFMIWTMACGLAPNWPAFLVFRFLCGAFASAPIAIVTGIFADVYADPVSRGRAMAWFMATTVSGPLFAPIVSGFCATSIGWRWSFWVALIYAGVTIIPVILLPETYAPVLLARRAAKIRKNDPSAEVYAAFELERKDFKQLATVVLTRPIRMFLTEPIVTATCLYLALVYAIFYMSFQAFPIIFQDVYSLSPGVTGLCYLPIGAGALIALPVFFGYDHYLAKARARDAPWTRKEESRRLPLATIGGPMFVVSLFWLGWSARPEVPFVVPMLAGIPFGFGFMMIFMAMLNYITDAYEIFAASANAASSSTRSTFAVVLPLATTPMFQSLGIGGACSLLGGLSALMSIIPFLFIWKGEKLRAASKFCIALRERKLEMERKAEEQSRRRAARQARAKAEEAGNV